MEGYWREGGGGACNEEETPPNLFVCDVDKTERAKRLVEKHRKSTPAPIFLTHLLSHSIDHHGYNTKLFTYIGYQPNLHLNRVCSYI